MKEIIFRGKSPSGKWIYGNVLCRDTCISIKNDFGDIKFGIASNGQGEDNCKYMLFEIPNENTIGQYVGVIDKNHKMVFEGDIIKTKLSGLSYIVKFNNGSIVGEDENGHRIIINQENMYMFDYEVIGNEFEK